MKRLLLLAAFLALLVTVMGIGRPRWRAGRLLATVDGFEVGKTDGARVRQLATSYGDDAVCMELSCGFHFSNAWLARLHLAPITQFSVLVQMASPEAGGRVAMVDLAMLVDRPGAMSSALVFDRGQAEPRPQPASITFDVDGRASRTVVDLDAATAANQRAAAHAFQLACLTRIGGCRSSLELLPGVGAGRPAHPIG